MHAAFQDIHKHNGSLLVGVKHSAPLEYGRQLLDNCVNMKQLLYIIQVEELGLVDKAKKQLTLTLG